LTAVNGRRAASVSRTHSGEPITLDGNEGVFYAGAARVEIGYPEELLARLDALRQREAKT
jgi:pyruvate,orthophosphate dikinase